MGKSYELEKYYSKNQMRSKDDFFRLVEEGGVIYGDFINNKIYRESFTKIPKAGILVLEEDALYFYGSKSLLEKEFFFSIPYEDIQVTSAPAFVINFKILTKKGNTDKCKISISWEDYVIKNIKRSFLSLLSDKIIRHLLKTVHNFLENEEDSEQANYYYQRILEEGIFSNRFIRGIVSLYKKQALEISENNDSIYFKYLKEKRKALKEIYADKHSLIEELFDDNKRDNNIQSSMEFFDSFYSESFINEKSDQNNQDSKSAILSSEILKSDHFSILLEEELAKKEEELREVLNQEYKKQLEIVSEKMEIEKSIYREIITDNLAKDLRVNFKPEISGLFLDKLVSTYYSHKLLKENFPATFTIERNSPAEGLAKLKFILSEFSGETIKIIDPYFFPSELDLLEDVPKQCNIRILTYALSSSNYKSKLEELKDKLEELRENRFGKVEVKIISFKQKNASPLHDRNIFSDSWGLRLSNSLSQIGRKHDVICTRILNARERVVDEFDDYWYLTENSNINRFKNKLIITEY